MCLRVLVCDVPDGATLAPLPLLTSLSQPDDRPGIGTERHAARHPKGEWAYISLLPGETPSGQRTVIPPLGLLSLGRVLAVQHRERRRDDSLHARSV